MIRRDDTARPLSAGGPQAEIRHPAPGLRVGLGAALLVSTALVAPAWAAAPQVFSPAWQAARAGARARTGVGAGSSSLPVPSFARVQQSMANLRRTAAALSAARAAQQSARATALALAGTVPDGLAPGGLVPLPGAAAGSQYWQGANLPTQTQQTGTQQTVTVQQTGKQAVLYWQTFNVGSHTTLHFDQSAGGAAANTWVALNRIADPNAQPSQILGSITAPGQVYVINRNGVIFGATSQVNVGSLIASAADIDTASFLKNGIFSTQGTASVAPSFTGAAGPIVVEPGALIATNPPAGITNGGGFVLLMGTSVTNGGEISTPNGQAAMVAGRNIDVVPGTGNSTGADPLATVQGNELAVASGGGTATNTGIMQATDGDVSIVGRQVIQGGVVLSSTGLGQRGTVHLLTDVTDAAGSAGSGVTLAPGSVTAITIDNSGTTALEALRSNAVVASTTLLNDASGLGDVRDQSRIEITTGGSVDFGAGSLALATSGQVAVDAKGTALLESQAAIDVSGLVGVSVPVSANVFSVSIEPYNLRDSPVNRDTTLLNSLAVQVDARTLIYDPAVTTNGTVTTPARYYTGGGLLEVSGELGNVGHTIGEYATTAGSVVLNAANVVVQPTATINLAGGSVTYAASEVPQTWLIGSDGRLHNLNTATDTQVYTGVYGGFQETHPHWGITQVYFSPLFAPQQVAEPGYTVGRDAGTLTLSSPTLVFEGTVDGGTVVGEHQTKSAAGNQNQTGLLVTQTVVPQAGTLAIAPASGTGGTSGLLVQPQATNVVISDSLPAIADGLTGKSVIPKAVRDTATLSTAMLNASGLGTLIVESTKTISVTGAVTLANGGAITLAAPTVNVSAPLVTRGGTVSLGDSVMSTVAAHETAKTILPGVNVTSGAVIDTQGIWTNARLDPTALSGEAYINGGAVTIASVGSIALGAGTTIDASAGGYLTSAGALTGGAGGNITLTTGNNSGATSNHGLPALIGPSKQRALVLDGVLRSYGVTSGGTLTIAAPGIAIGDGLTPAYAGELLLSPSLFSSGFSSYTLTSATNIRIAPGAQVNVVEPVYQATDTSPYVPTGNDPNDAFQVVLPPLYLPNQERGTLTQRAGASLTLDAPNEQGVKAGNTNDLFALVPLHQYGGISLGQGAAITVDPGKSVILDATLQATIAGSITARGGTIQVLVTDSIATVNQSMGKASVWVGPDATLNASGIAVTALDTMGRPYGVVTAGGSIILGNTAGGATNNNLQAATDAFVVIRPGATLEASGVSASIDLDAGGPPALSHVVTDSTAGGTIRLASYTGIYADGILRAAAGGAAASGGTLDVVLETAFYDQLGSFATPQLDPYLKPRLIFVTQTPVLPLAGDNTPGEIMPNVGTADVSASGIAAGGFGTVLLSARDGIVFRGDVNLSVRQALTLEGPIGASTAKGHVSLSAPYILLLGPSVLPAQGGSEIFPYLSTPTGTVTGSTLSLASDLVDIENGVSIGSMGSIALANSAGIRPAFSISGFGSIDIASRGDVRFLNGTLETVGDLTITAAQVYAVTSETGVLEVGSFFGIPQTGSQVYINNPKAVLTIGRTPGTNPAPPLSVLGRLTISAPTIDQGGILRAPFGSITIGSATTPPDSKVTAPDVVNFLPGSITSISVAGETVPYGGTPDGLHYYYAGATVDVGPTVPSGNTEQAGGFFTPVDHQISLIGSAITIDAGATLDVSGGGTLSGAGFVAGRGGSTDTLYTPIQSFNAASHNVSAPALGASDQVFALLPSSNSGYAPSTAYEQVSSYPGSVPTVGETVTIGAGVAGLPAGTYTLLPAYYALQPGGYRIELRTGATAPLTGTQSLANGSFITAVTTGVANAGVQSTVPIQAIVSAGATVRRYSQYNEEDLATFARTQAAVTVFGDPVPFIPADAGAIALEFGARTPHTQALLNDGTVLVDPVAGGLGATLSVDTAGTADLIVGTPTTPAGTTVLVDASALDNFNAATLIVGGTTEPVSNGAIGAAVGNLTVAPGATLTASQVFLAADHTLSVESGAVVSTIGHGQPVLDSSSGTLFGFKAGAASTASILAVSSGYVAFGPGVQSGTSGGIVVATGATLDAADTLAFGTGQPVSISPKAVLGARIFSVAAQDINVGTPQTAARDHAPTGVLINQQLLDTLLAGDPAAGVPGLQELDVTANRSLNFFGPAQLNAIDPATGQSRLQTFVLNTPGIYGVGNTNDVAVLSVGTLYWNGLFQTDTFGTETAVMPALAYANGPGSGSGTLDIQARDVVFGPGPHNAPAKIELPRGIFGFSKVNLTGSQEITTTGTNSLLVYQTQTTLQPNGTLTGTGGTLTLVTPLLTGAAAGTLDITAGGDLTLSPGLAAPSIAVPDAAGQDISLTAASITDNTAIILPSGLLRMTATGSIALGAGARIDVSGENKAIFDQVTSGPGGTVNLDSTAGRVTQAAGGTIALGGATGQPGGTLIVDAAKGAVALGGTILGGGADAADSGGLTLDAGTLSQAAFTALNQSLTAGGVFGARSFEIGSGDLTIGAADSLRAHVINVSVDQGSLTVTGTVDASGARVGTITLAGQTGLTLAAGAVLDAAGSTLVTDSYGQPIDASNRAEVSLSSGLGTAGKAQPGTLTLASGATIDLSSADGIARGDLELNAPRATPTGGAILIAAAGTYDIAGAATIAVNGFAFYAPKTGVIVQSNTVATNGTIGLDQINADSSTFENAALQAEGTLSGLTSLAGFHLRPGVMIDSNATKSGDLRVIGDLNLAGFRYGPTATGDGSGEPGVLILRATGNLNIDGSISDGFQAAPKSPDANGWVVFSANAKAFGLGAASYNGATITLLKPVVLAAKTMFAADDLTLTYSLPISRGAAIKADAPTPTQVTLDGPAKLSEPWIAQAQITVPPSKQFPQGQVFKAGETIPAQTLPPGTKLAKGATLPVTFAIKAVTIPAGTNLAIFNSTLTLSGPAPLKVGDIIPGDATIILPAKAAGVGYVATRPTLTGGTQGAIDPLAAMLPAGALSWSIGLVGGANQDAANPLAVLAPVPGKGGGNIVLDDAHYSDAQGYLPSTILYYTNTSSMALMDNLNFSVVRTGTGALTLAAQGSVNQLSPFGIYTAGTQTSVDPGYETTTISDTGLQVFPQYQPVVQEQIGQGYQPYYPADGGNLTVRAQGDITTTGGANSGSTSDWLWTQPVPGQLASWWINFGTYQQTNQAGPRGTVYGGPTIEGFAGLGALGGGNVSLYAGGDGGTASSGFGVINSGAGTGSNALQVAVASTGRVLSVSTSGTVVLGGSIAQTGGGDLSIDVAGVATLTEITNTRGSIRIDAGSVGTVTPVAGTSTSDPRFITDPLTAETANITATLTLAVGDGVADVTTRTDLSLLDAVDPGLASTNFLFTSQYPKITQGNTTSTADTVASNFSLYQPQSGITLLSTGGNVSPSQARSAVNIPAFYYPPSLDITAQHGSIYYQPQYPVELSPSASGTLKLLAADSIYALPAVTGSYSNVILMSGAPVGVDALPNPFKPVSMIVVNSNTSSNATNYTGGDPLDPFVFENDTPAGPNHPAGAQPVLVYAGTGDIVSLQVGQPGTAQVLSGVGSPIYQAALPAEIRAGRDIVNFTGLSVNNTASDVSVLEAGRDIIYANDTIGGPGLLYVQAGRDVYQGATSDIVSIGQYPVDPNVSAADRGNGAAVTVLAGVGNTGPDYSAFADLYLNDANLANPALQITDPANAGKVQQTYGAALLAWLQANTGYTGDQAGALAAFEALPAERQSEFLLPTYFDELRLSGRQFTDPTSRFYKSYARGKQVIASLFPGNYQGDITLFGSPGASTASAITTNFGGDITVLAPGGSVLLGTTTPGVYPATYGLITFGQGNVDIYSQGSVLLGTSRVFTTFGGGITIWSAQGDINAGQGSKSTVVAQPFQLSYDQYGNITLSPQAPSSGAGIATLAEIPGTVAGDVDLVAPQGTIDAGEAGIRSSGNANLAALSVANAANITVKGSTSGVPVIAVPNIGALAAAGAVAGGAQNNAQQVGTQNKRKASDSIITVDVLGFGG